MEMDRNDPEEATRGSIATDSSTVAVLLARSLPDAPVEFSKEAEALLTQNDRL
jgi:hypothetical protein